MDITQSLAPGLTARPLTMADARDVWRVMAALGLAEIGTADIEEADIVADWQRPSVDVPGVTMGVFDGDRLVGCNAIGWTEHVGVMRGLVEGQVPLGPWKQTLLRDPTQLMAAYLACAQAQSAHAHVGA